MWPQQHADEIRRKEAQVKSLKARLRHHLNKSRPDDREERAWYDSMEQALRLKLVMHEYLLSGFKATVLAREFERMTGKRIPHSLE